jgi:hypothetical protein
LDTAVDFRWAAELGGVRDDFFLYFSFFPNFAMMRGRGEVGRVRRSSRTFPAVVLITGPSLSAERVEADKASR